MTEPLLKVSVAVAKLLPKTAGPFKVISFTPRLIPSHCTRTEYKIEYPWTEIHFPLTTPDVMTELTETGAHQARKTTGMKMEPTKWGTQK